MKKWNDFSCLGLLDDVIVTEPPSRAWEDLTRTAHQAAEKASRAKAQAEAQAIAARKAAIASAPPAIERKVFSSRPTLRQMMQEYNKRTARVAPIKGADLVASRSTFRFEKVDLIRIPTIPGKILRPVPAGHDVD